MTRISIITPVFNGARFIMDAASSVQAQTWSDWEWIIINDGSTDATAALLEGLGDPRIRVIHQVNAGAGAARNVGLDHAQGEYVSFLDADDLLPSTMLTRRGIRIDCPWLTSLPKTQEISGQYSLLTTIFHDRDRWQLNRAAAENCRAAFGVCS
jgi:glycosyltransferase involved in cell wall biosynthesis